MNSEPDKGFKSRGDMKFYNPIILKAELYGKKFPGLT